MYQNVILSDNTCHTEPNVTENIGYLEEKLERLISITNIEIISIDNVQIFEV